MGNKTTHIDSEQLVKRYQNGEEQALKLLIRRFHPTLIRVIRHQIRGADSLEDIAQECWYVIIPKLADVKLKISFEVWAITIARRKAIDWVREQQRSRAETKKLEAEMKSQPHDNSCTENVSWDLETAIRELPPTQRIVLEMFYLENLSLQEISKVLAIAEGTVKSRLFYAREKLKSIVN